MRVRILTLSLALVFAGSAIGCKSAPKLPWFKTADASTTPAASTTAAGAPQLPSEVAKQAAGLAGTDPVKITTAPASMTAKAPAPVASSYSATPVSGSYPSTGAQDYLSNAGATLKSAAAATAATAKSALPYDPAAVPPAATNTASRTALAAQQDRYTPASDRYANSDLTTSLASSPASYAATAAAGTPGPTATTTAAPVAATTPAPFATNPASMAPGDRYATQGAPSTAASAPATSYAAQVQPASAIAAAQPYRPGGTSSYPGTSASYEVATKSGLPTTGSSTDTGYGAASGTMYR